MKLSIIVPVYNGEKTIERCIDSIARQSFKEFELIIINDGSTDSTHSILEDFCKRDERIKVVKTENFGQGSARNTGIKMATGAYVGFVDSDDEIHCQMYEIMLEKIGDADVCQCNIINAYPNGARKVQLSNYQGTVEVLDRRRYFDDYLFRTIHSIESCNKLIKKDFLIENGIWFGDNKEVYSEDLLLNINIAKNLKKIVFVKEPLYCYYQNTNSHSKKHTIEKVRKLCVLFEKVYEEQYKYEISKIAVLNIMLNLSCLEHDYSEITKRKDVRKYIWNSFLSMKKLKHKIIMLMLLIAPKLVITTYYRQWR
ncbi:MAG: glycosyltransferase [Firmicutes bacterium]|nr:glycosyltransferase [Bacillota bacterium]